MLDLFQQMEVPCYTDGKIQEFSDQIQRLKQEYRAYLRKLRALEPDISAASWADRPYTNRKQHAGSATVDDIGGYPSSSLLQVVFIVTNIR